jgi:hypothetical protein
MCLFVFMYVPARSETIKEGAPQIGCTPKLCSDFEGFAAQKMLTWFHVLLVDTEQLDFWTVFLAHRE